ncbi:jg2695, partial [Pararge aegeria aegeria]
YLQMILSDDLKAQDSVNAFTFLYIGSRSNTKHALEFIKNRLEDVRKKVVLPAWFESVLSNLASYAPEDVLKDTTNIFYVWGFYALKTLDDARGNLSPAVEVNRLRVGEW